MLGACNIAFGLYYCDEDRVKNRDYAHPIRLRDRACKHYKALIVDCDAGVKIMQYYNRYYVIDEASNVIASSNLKDIAIIKAYKYIRDCFLLQKKQLDLFEAKIL
jgi:hypothetical protein